MLEVTLLLYPDFGIAVLFTEMKLKSDSRKTGDGRNEEVGFEF